MIIPETVSFELTSTDTLPDFQVLHDEARAAVLNGQSALSLHRPLGRLVVDPGLLAEVTGQIAELDQQEAFIDTPTGFQLRQYSALRLRNLPLLRTLVDEADAVFRNVVQADVADTAASQVLTTVTVGPYEPRPIDSRWHRDFACNPRQDIRAVTYNVDLIGQITTLSNGSYAEHDFYNDRVKETAMPSPEHQHQYEPGTIVAIDGTHGVYRTDDEVRRGQPALSLRSFVIGALARH